MIRHTLAALVRSAVFAAQAAGDLPAFELAPVEIGRPPKPEMGDYSTSLPLKLASVAKRAPLNIATVLVKHLPADPAVAQVDTAAPGFINFTLAPAWLHTELERILAANGHFGNVDLGKNQRVQIEFVSANPTGPLTVGSARNMAIGDVLARIMQAAGYRVDREYYVNDAGSQVRHLGESIYAKYAQQLGRTNEPFPEDGYKGEYVDEMARTFVTAYGDKFLQMPKDEAVRQLKRLGVAMVIEQLKVSLARARVEFDVWFSEQSLRDSGLLDQVLKNLSDKGYVYEKDGAQWFQATAFGLDKDAVLVRSAAIVTEPDERPTYLASDLPYVWDKLVLRGFDRAIYIWGADHQGDVPRVYAGAQALGIDPKRITIIIYQLVRLTRGGEKVRMSKRAGEFDTLDDLLADVGVDAVRFMLAATSADTAMDFDLKLAVEQSNENPVYYVQYSHARIASILRNAADAGVSHAGANLALLEHPAELDLIKQMLKLEEVIEHSVQKLEPHHLPHYSMELASSFNQFYQHCRVLSPDPADAEMTRARLQLVTAAKQVLARCLDLLGVSAPEAM